MYDFSQSLDSLFTSQDDEEYKIKYYYQDREIELIGKNRIKYLDDGTTEKLKPKTEIQGNYVL